MEFEERGCSYLFSGGYYIPYIANYLFEHPGLVPLDVKGTWVSDGTFSTDLVGRQIGAYNFAEVRTHVSIECILTRSNPRHAAMGSYVQFEQHIRGRGCQCVFCMRIYGLLDDLRDVPAKGDTTPSPASNYWRKPAKYHA